MGYYYRENYLTCVPIFQINSDSPSNVNFFQRAPTKFAINCWQVLSSFLSKIMVVSSMKDVFEQTQIIVNIDFDCRENFLFISTALIKFQGILFPRFSKDNWSPFWIFSVDVVLLFSSKIWISPRKFSQIKTFHFDFDLNRCVFLFTRNSSIIFSFRESDRSSRWKILQESSQGTGGVSFLIICEGWRSCRRLWIVAKIEN